MIWDSRAVRATDLARAYVEDRLGGVARCAAGSRQCSFGVGPKQTVRPMGGASQVASITRVLTAGAIRCPTQRLLGRTARPRQRASGSVAENGKESKVLEALAVRVPGAALSRERRDAAGAVGGEDEPLQRCDVSRGRSRVCSFQVPAEVLCDARLRSFCDGHGVGLSPGAV